MRRRCAPGSGVPHDAALEGWDGSGNLQDAARRRAARADRGLGAAHGLADVAAGPHARRPGRDGADAAGARRRASRGWPAMRERSAADGVTWLRPLLGLGRAELRDYLARGGASVVEDPQQRRPRLRPGRHGARSLQLRRWARRASVLPRRRRRLDMARAALERAWRSCAARATVEPAARATWSVDRAAFADWPDETRLRLLAARAALDRGRAVPPAPGAACGRALEAAGGAARLAGVLIAPAPDELRVTREAEAAAARAAPDAPWDGRWRVAGPARPGDVVAALGEAADRVPGWRGCRPAARRRCWPRPRSGGGCPGRRAGRRPRRRMVGFAGAVTANAFFAASDHALNDRAPIFILQQRRTGSGPPEPDRDFEGDSPWATRATSPSGSSCSC